jgi:arylsulfatase A
MGPGSVMQAISRMSPPQPEHSSGNSSPTIPQQVFETPKMAGHVAVEARDADTRIDGNPDVLQGEHVGGGSSVHLASEPEPADHAAADSLGERGQIGLHDRPRWDERRRSITRRCGSSRHEDAIGHAHMEMHVVVERGAETLQEGDAAEPRAARTRCLGIRGPACRREQEPFDLGQEDLRDRRDGSGWVGEHAAQPLRHGDHPLPHGYRRDDVIGEVGGRSTLAAASLTGLSLVMLQGWRRETVNSCRPTMILLAVLAAAGPFLTAATRAGERPPIPRTPNVVIFLADDLGYGSVGYQGGKPRTPTLDTLAREAVRFTDFYSGAPNCSPSRSSLLTGRSATRVGMYNWRPGQNPMVLRTDEVTLAELLRDAGYRTGVFGKWHLGEVLPANGATPIDHGFEYSFVTDLNAVPSHRNPVNFIRNGVAVGETDGYSCQLLVTEAIGQLATYRPDQPFFHYIAFHEPHTPIASPPELVAGYPGTTDAEAIYFANVENVDRAVGRYLAALRDRGLFADTLVLFTSDNGPVRPGSSGGLRAQKESLYDGGIKVPAVLSWPAGVPQPRVVTEPVGIVDVLPSVCAATGVAAPTNRVLDGANVLPLLTGAAFARNTPLFWHYFNGNPGAVMRSGDWNLVAGTTGFRKVEHRFAPPMMEIVRNREFDTVELYNVRDDPAQRTDLADQQPQRVAELRKQLLDLLTAARAEGFDWRDGNEARGRRVP